MKEVCASDCNRIMAINSMLYNDWFEDWSNCDESIFHWLIKYAIYLFIKLLLPVLSTYTPEAKKCNIHIDDDEDGLMMMMMTDDSDDGSDIMIDQYHYHDNDNDHCSNIKILALLAKKKLWKERQKN